MHALRGMAMFSQPLLSEKHLSYPQWVYLVCSSMSNCLVAGKDVKKSTKSNPQWVWENQILFLINISKQDNSPRPRDSAANFIFQWLNSLASLANIPFISPFTQDKKKPVTTKRKKKTEIGHDFNLLKIVGIKRDLGFAVSCFIAQSCIVLLHSQMSFTGYKEF